MSFRDRDKYAEQWQFWHVSGKWASSVIKLVLVESVLLEGNKGTVKSF